MSSFGRISCVLACGALLCVLHPIGVVQAQDEPAADKPAAIPPKTHAVATTDLVLQLERDGRIDSSQRTKVRVIPDAYKGPFEIVEVLHRGGRILKGEPILRFSSEEYEKELENARMSVDHARKRLDMSREEQRLLVEANAVKIEQVEKNRIKAQKELSIWDQYEKADNLRSAELGLKQREYSLSDQKQELQQLEEMYSGTQLANQTKEIVLERSRRGVRMSEAFLEIGKNNYITTTTHRHPMQDMQVRDAARWAMQEEAHARITTRASELRKEMELESAERGLKEVEDRLAKLEKDGEWLTLTAPADGVMTKIELEPKDTVNARQNICEVLDPSTFLVKVNLTPDDLRVLYSASGGEAAPLRIVLPEFPEVEVTGAIREVAEIGTGAEKATHFPAVVALKSNSPLVRVGLRCNVFATRTLSGVLAIPRGL